MKTLVPGEWPGSNRATAPLADAMAPDSVGYMSRSPAPAEERRSRTLAASGNRELADDRFRLSRVLRAFLRLGDVPGFALPSVRS